MEIGNIIPHIEALIFASDKPLTSMEITELINNAFGFMEEKLTLEQIQTSIDGIREKYSAEFYPFEVRESGGGWQFLTKKDFHKTVAQLNGEKFLKRLSSAALETLAIIAYKQPITKGEIEAIRGVSSDYSIQKLLEKELIIISGRNEEMPGKPLVYATSKGFMDYFGINSPADLPKLKEVFAETMIEPTVITHGSTETLAEDANIAPEDGGEIISDESILIVSENGELLEHEASADDVSAAELAADAETITEEQDLDAADAANATSEEHFPEDPGFADEQALEAAVEAEDEEAFEEQEEAAEAGVEEDLQEDEDAEEVDVEGEDEDESAADEADEEGNEDSEPGFPEDPEAPGPHPKH